ncbi:hypothetical protein DPMN_143542 [Dreissena polymorpha]|uniref:Uncharacterized protein n=1 Tax=Dreissena polymorpha TaxID=45954 RepID=A0A9D4GGJ5_DREPO|nr:hypothetical protein DPMN_143542 [Dreissena polymorpha]
MTLPSDGVACQPRFLAFVYTAITPSRDPGLTPGVSSILCVGCPYLGLPEKDRLLTVGEFGMSFAVDIAVCGGFATFR